MGFLSFWPLALLVLVPIIILLYILRQETKTKEFSSSMLWQEVVRNMEATKPWEKLKRNILLFLQILTVILFIAAMMRPWIKGLGGKDAQMILVIDNSASMASLYDDSKTRLEAAKEAACAYVDELSGNTSIYVISGNQQAVLELANSSDRFEAKDKIKKIEQTSLAGDLSVALGLVESCSNQAANPQIVFFTDSAFDTGDLVASIDSFYSECVNVSMDSVSYAVKDGKLEVLAQCTNYSGEKLDREINLYGIDESGKESLLDIGSVDIEGGKSNSVYFDIDTTSLPKLLALKAEINEKDGLVEDNASWCVIAESNEKKALLLTESNMFIEKAVENMAGIEVYRTSDKEVFDEETDYDLYIFDGMLPAKLPDHGSILCINCDKCDMFKSDGEVSGTKITLGDCEVTTYIADTKIGVNKSYTYELPSWAKAYMQTGKKDSKVCGFYGIYDGIKVATIGFDLHQTDFGLTAEFPILVSNLTGYLLDGSLIEDTSYTAGDSIMLHGSTKGSNLSLVYPDGKVTNIAASEVAGSYLQLDTPGLYTVSQEINKETKQQQFTVLFPTREESTVESASNTIASNDKITETDIKTGTRDLSQYLMVLLLILMLLEWIVYVRML